MGDLKEFCLDGLCGLSCLLKESKKLLKDIGFTQFCTFDKMEPVFHKL